jgi:hypothetical protein
MYVLFVQNIQDCQSDRVVITDEVAGNLETSDHETAFLKFVSEINSDIMVDRKAFLLSTLLERFRTFLPKEHADKYLCQDCISRLKIFAAECKICSSERVSFISLISKSI